MWENKDFTMRVEENTFKNYERIMLTSGECSFFMPMGFFGEDGCEVVSYDCSGFAPLSSYRIEKTEDALFILENVLIIVGKSVEYLITPAKIKVTTDTVFYNRETGQVKIAYIPNSGENVNLRTNIALFIGQLGEDIIDDNKGCLMEIAKLITYNNYYIREIVNKIGLCRRQLYMEKKRKQVSD